MQPVAGALDPERVGGDLGELAKQLEQFELGGRQPGNAQPGIIQRPAEVRGVLARIVGRRVGHGSLVLLSVFREPVPDPG
jgi:hypothetical protein